MNNGNSGTKRAKKTPEAICKMGVIVLKQLHDAGL
jgi:hypothetical protein